METTKVFIYCLKHPQTNEIRYIGKANNVRKRLLSHLVDSKTRKTPIYFWINKLKSEGLKPIIEVLVETDSENWQRFEIETISQFKKAGYRLLNLADGGNQPICDKEVRCKNGKANALAIHSDPVKKRFWYLKKELGAYFKKVGDTPKVLFMKEQLATRGVYFK